MSSFARQLELGGGEAETAAPTNANLFPRKCRQSWHLTSPPKSNAVGPWQHQKGFCLFGNKAASSDHLPLRSQILSPEMCELV